MESTEITVSEENLTNATCDGLGEASFVVLLSLAVLYFSGLIICGTIYFVYFLRMLRVKSTQVHTSTNTITKYVKLFRGYLRQLKSGDTIFGKIVISASFLLNLAYICLAIYRSLPPKNVEECISITDPAILVELVIVIWLLLFFLIRLLATNNILLYWMTPHSIVDILTLPHIFITLALGVDYIGLRALRFVWLTQITLVMQFARLIRSQNMLDILNLMVYFVILWLTSSGILYVIEAEGDFWSDIFNGSTESVLVYVYLTMVTISTVGYGDVSPVTATGRAFMIVFIIAGLAFFAAILPTLVDVVVGYYARTEYAKFDTSRVPRHVIVCGHITATSADDFLKDFLHPIRGDKQTHILFLHPKRPDPELKDVLRTHYTRVQFLLGSALDARKLHTAKILSSMAVFILADKLTNDPKDEDHANMLRAVSIKNTTTRVPIIIQLVHSFSKRKVIEIDGWVVGRDIAICLNQLKLGVLAQSCLCPRFSTLLSNLFYIAVDDNRQRFRGSDKWKGHYFRGLANEIYSGPFSAYFDGKTFHEAAKICFNKLNLVLLALDHNNDEERRFYVNPSKMSHPELRIQSRTMLGYFMAHDQHRVYHASIYCECCADNKHVAGTNFGREFRIQFNANRKALERPLERPLTFLDLKRVTSIPTSGEGSVNSALRIDVSANEDPSSDHKSLLRGQNKTGSDELESVADNITPANENDHKILPHGTSLETDDEDDGGDDNEDELQEGGEFHVHVCLPVSLEESTLNPNLLSISSNTSLRVTAKTIRGHIVLCLFANAKSPLLGLQNFLKPLRNKHLSLDSIKPVVIICERDFIEKEWPIICKFPKVYVVTGSPLLWTNLRAARVSKCSACVVLTALPNSSYHDPAINDKEVILCSLSIKKRLKKLNKKVLIVTDLRHESNVQFLDFGDEDAPDERIYKAEPFACGEAFSVSMFDSVTSAAFHGPGSLYFAEDLIHSTGVKSVCQVISSPILGTNFSGKTYSEFYNAQLLKSNICMGISRKLPSSSSQSYVIAHPSPNLVLDDSDFVFILTEI